MCVWQWVGGCYSKQQEIEARHREKDNKYAKKEIGNKKCNFFALINCSYHAGGIDGGIVFGDQCFDQLIVTLVRHIVQRRPAGLRFAAKQSMMPEILDF